MNWRSIRAIVRKDINVVLSSKGILFPLIIVPLTLTIALPAFVGSLPQMFEIPDLTLSTASQIQQWMDRIPAPLLAELSVYDDNQRIVILMIVYYLAPMYLILPLMVASVIAADSIVGEKERKTLEALLYTPTTDEELYIGKFIAAWLPAVAIAWGGFVTYSLVANLAAWPTMHRIFFPTPMWLVLAFWVAPATAGLGLSFIVAISSQVGTFQEAYQIGGVVVVPIVALLISQAAGFIYFGAGFVFLIGAAFWLVDLFLLWLGSRSFRRVHLTTNL